MKTQRVGLGGWLSGWLLVAALGLGVPVGRSLGATSPLGMQLRVVDARGCARSIEVRADSTFASGELAPGTYTLWWGTSPAAARRAVEHHVSGIIVWHRGRWIATGPGAGAAGGEAEGKKLVHSLDPDSPMLTTKVGTVVVPPGADGLEGKLEFTTADGRKVSVEEWLGARSVAATR